MILTCPQCATRYQTDAAQFPAQGRKVRCTKCGHVWHQPPLAPEPEPGLDLAAEIATPMGVSAPPGVASMRNALSPASGQSAQPGGRRTGERTAAIAAWAGFAAMMILIGWSAIAYRETIGSVWPRSATFYKLIGWPVNVTGIAITDVSSHRELTGGQAVLTVTGKLVNISGHELAVPQVEVLLKDGNRRELDRWDFSPGVAVLRPGQKIAFSTRRANPPQAARQLEVTLAEAGG